MLDQPQIVQTAEQLTAVIRFTVPRSELMSVMGPGYGELMAAVAAQGIAPAGPWFTHHLRVDPDTFDFELGVPVSREISAAGRVQASHLPAARVARTIYHGDYAGLPAAWEEFKAWIAAQELTPGTTLWESFVAGPEANPDPTTWRTELNRPLAK